MIILKSLNLKNFLSHSETNLSFRENDKMLLDGLSGSGKTSIVEALTFCLYGEARCPNKDLVKRGEKTATVTLNLFNDEDGLFYMITRSTTDKAKNALTVGVFKEGEEIKPIEKNGLRDTQDFIEKELLHCSYTLFTNSIAYVQGNINSFVNQTATKRKDLLLEIANVTDFDLFYSRARDLLTLKNEEKARIESAIETSLGFIEKQKENIIDENALDSETIGIQYKIEDETRKLESISVQKKMINDSLSAINKLNSQISYKKVESGVVDDQTVRKLESINLIKAIDVQKIKDKLAEGDVLKDKKALLEGKIKADYERTQQLNAILSDRPNDIDYDSQIMEINKRLIPLIKETGKCPSGDLCPFTIPIQNQITYLGDQINEKIAAKALLEKQKDVFKQKMLGVGPSLVTPEILDENMRIAVEFMVYDDCRVMLATAEAKIVTLPVLEAEYSDLVLKKISLMTELSTLELELKEKTAMQSVIDTTGLDAEEAKLRSGIASLTGILTGINNKISISKNARANITKIEKDIKKEQESISKLKGTLESIQAIKEAFGNKGLKVVIVDHLVPLLEDKINGILSELSDFSVRLDTQKTSSDGENAIEGLFINVKNPQGEEFLFENLSGGEGVKVSMAIAEALASLSPKMGFRIIDEAINSLDNESTQSFVEVLCKLQEKFSQLLIISHLPEIKDIFEKRITIIKVNGNSKIINEEKKDELFKQKEEIHNGMEEKKSRKSKKN